MAALPNIGGALCSVPQSLADVHYLTVVQSFFSGFAFKWKMQIMTYQSKT